MTDTEDIITRSAARTALDALIHKRRRQLTEVTTAMRRLEGEIDALEEAQFCIDNMMTGDSDEGA